MPRDIAVVGGSVAGLYSALLLARNGHRVTLYEASEELSLEPRSLIVTSAFRDILGALGEPAVVNEIHRFSLIAGERVAEVPLRRPDLIIERAELVTSLAAEARRAGVRLVPGARLQELQPVDGGLQLAFADAEASVHVSAVVGADGARSVVAREAGWPSPKMVPVIQALVSVDEETADTTRVWFVPEDTPYFYWLIPHGDRTGALGIIAEDPEGARQRLDTLARELGLVVHGYQGARIPEYRGWRSSHRQLGDGDVYLVGDAAAHVKVTTVGGIVNGLWGAEGICHKIGVNGHGPPRTLGSLRLELGLHLLIRRALHAFRQEDYGELLAVLDDPTRSTLARYSRDEALQLMLRLLARRPRLALLGLRGLWRTALRS